MAQLLLNHGANPEKRDKEGKSPYYLAKLFNHQDVRLPGRGLVSVLPQMMAMLPPDENYDFVSFLCDRIENDPLVAANRILVASRKGKKGKKGGKKKKTSIHPRVHITAKNIFLFILLPLSIVGNFKPSEALLQKVYRGVYLKGAHTASNY